MGIPLLLDCDTGIDDSLALLYLLGRTDVDLVAIASTAGNVPTDVVVANNLAWLELCGRDDVPVHRGAPGPVSAPLRTAEDTHGPRGVGYAELPPASRAASPVDAARAWIDAGRRHPGTLVGLAIGPLTNLALAIRADLDLPTRMRRLVIMGGAFGVAGNTTPVAEWNMVVDPEAAAEVFAAFDRPDAPDPLVCGLNITEQMRFTPRHLAQLRDDAAGVLTDHLADALRFYFEFHDAQDEGYLAYLHDPFAAMVALAPESVTAVPARVAVELAGTHTRAMTVADRRWMTGPPNALVVTEADTEAMLDGLVEALARLAQHLAD
ncbi:nucleoside hydrolase [Gordonia sp. X0973]|uniref:nucleoside hydrolase n=1 Tax=Gordonia sp. X0973 TaxID=2742602 RepID=UPI000F51F172|nr:nucleoside hydrolase [Gordonia sp. X0973]QKT07221.1 nucleoside hydrolase [Gordonia sp. X0973]